MCGEKKRRARVRCRVLWPLGRLVEAPAAIWLAANSALGRGLLRARRRKIYRASGPLISDVMGVD
jgi:hypothetical protein